MAELIEKKNEKAILLEFKHTYRAHTALWKVKAKEYSNKQARNKGLTARGTLRLDALFAAPFVN